jgi:phage shock protein A
MNAKLTQLVIDLEMRLRQLLHRHKTLQSECRQVKQQLQQQQLRVAELEAMVHELEEKYAHLKMAKYIDMADNDVKQMRGRISQMVRDIDKCIAMIRVE